MAEILRHSRPEDLQTVETVKRRHGRLERRILVVRTVPAGETWDWPGVCQIGSIRRLRIHPHTGQILSDETVYFITSLTPAPATPAQLPALARGHWTIENKVHHVLDVTFHEDASRLRKGNGPQVLAVFRRLVRNRLRWNGVTNTALALSSHAANSWQALGYLY